MKMRSRKEMAKELWKKDAKEVNDYLDSREVKECFRSEETFLNAIGKLLISDVKKSPIYKVPTTENFWVSQFEAMTIRASKKVKTKTVLYVIRLLNGQKLVPERKESEEDFGYLDSDEMRRDLEREKWNF